MSTRIIRPLIRSDAANASLGVASAGKIIQADAAGHAAASFIRASKSTFASSVSGFTHTTVESALNALAGSRALAYGSNANGFFRRWEDGVQEAWLLSATFTYSNDITLAYTWTFPAAFNTAPVVQHTVRTISGGAVSFGEFSAVRVASIPDGNSCLLQLICSTVGADRFAPGDTATFLMRAIGTWK